MPDTTITKIELAVNKVLLNAFPGGLIPTSQGTHPAFPAAETDAAGDGGGRIDKSAEIRQTHQLKARVCQTRIRNQQLTGRLLETLALTLYTVYRRRSRKKWRPVE